MGEPLEWQNWAKFVFLTPCKNWRSDRATILGLFITIICASCAFFRFSICCSVLKQERLECEWGRKSEQNLPIFWSPKNMGGLVEMSVEFFMRLLDSKRRYTFYPTAIDRRLVTLWAGDLKINTHRQNLGCRRLNKHTRRSVSGSGLWLYAYRTNDARRQNYHSVFDWFRRCADSTTWGGRAYSNIGLMGLTRH